VSSRRQTVYSAAPWARSTWKNRGGADGDAGEVRIPRATRFAYNGKFASKEWGAAGRSVRRDGEQG